MIEGILILIEWFGNTTSSRKLKMKPLVALRTARMDLVST
ncbi:hypothetical protein LEP1GSC171_3408 [Leptospira santarosai str. HAI1380]|uniref:Uncharacterized protein n=3 Tax=Leptospira santarosai TaxID=28183 RepID=M6USV3_9LEPT|nr:hypothetical protein LEP1GSC179_3335 [Leptospira santarosai str. MOR084]EKS09863.1 hypothetical protein LEP1GSC071_2352 [Leptospira santarosai str. JET]EKT87917.1 hypothetical protein LSS_04726 [Leptospira santarosai serovar Shermani str. LT 821]EMF92607.1 hypothetical protein LEP1GSC005_3318 [Leptospira santarosai str. ST188]EMJ47079.1 hypothetical protein LEP1GSC169_3746 [Leptospira santarosai str. HAI1349]EMM75332.1 hypothetical protein LEP1GSC040_3182 [Leptospira santarosai str. 2000030